MSSTRMTEIGAVFVPVSDQERSLAFYVERLGFELRADFTYGAEGLRWIEVAPPGATNSIALVGPGEGRAQPRDAALCAFATEDLEADHAMLRDRGVDIDAEIGRTGTRRPGLVSPQAGVGDPVPAQCCFRDPDGNRFLLVQPG